jgi:DNA-binding response OmpR family regulator
MRILLLEDEESIRGFLRINLKRNDMDVTEAENGEDALAYAYAGEPFDIALLDVMLPTISGFEVCEQLRRDFPAMGIIMLTAKAQEQDKIYGLELGADDYIQKPFSPGELIARIKSLHRRMGAVRTRTVDPKDVSDGKAATEGTGALSRGELAGLAGGEAGLGPSSANAQTSGIGGSGYAFDVASSDSGNTASDSGTGRILEPGSGFSSEADSGEGQSGLILLSGPFRLSVPERKLWKDGQEIVLTPTEWTLVRLLMERQGTSVSRDQILNDVWGRYYVGDLKVVDVNIRRIRQKIESNPSNPSVIETVWGFGYRWKRSVQS